MFQMIFRYFHVGCICVESRLQRQQTTRKVLFSRPAGKRSGERGNRGEVDEGKVLGVCMSVNSGGGGAVRVEGGNVEFRPESHVDHGLTHESSMVRQWLLNGWVRKYRSCFKIQSLPSIYFVQLAHVRYYRLLSSQKFSYPFFSKGGSSHLFVRNL